MIKKMAKILLPWFILTYLPNLSARSLIYAGNALGVSAMVGFSLGNNVLTFPISIFTVFSLLGLVISAILQEKGNLKAGRGVHIGFTCAAMGLMLSYYAAVILFPVQLLRMLAAPEEAVRIGAVYLRAAGLTIILLICVFLLIGQLIMKKPSLKATLIVAGVMLAHMWIGILMLFLFNGGMGALGAINGVQISVCTILPFAFIPMRSYGRTFGPEEKSIPQAAE